MPSPRACHPGPATALLSWCPGCLRGILAWGLWADPAPGRCFSPPRPAWLPLPTWGTGEVSGPTPALVALEASASWDRGRGCRGPRPLHGMEPPAAACHVAQHVTALPCCLELSQATAVAEPAPGGAGLGLSLTALSQESGPERGSRWSKATQQIRDPPGEVVVGEMGVSRS